MLLRGDNRISSASSKPRSSVPRAKASDAIFLLHKLLQSPLPQHGGRWASLDGTPPSLPQSPPPSPPSFNCIFFPWVVSVSREACAWFSPGDGPCLYPVYRQTCPVGGDHSHLLRRFWDDRNLIHRHVSQGKIPSDRGGRP